MRGIVCKTDNLTEKIRFQQAGIALLKREIFGTDKKPRSRYIQEFVDQYRTFESLSSYPELVAAARAARIVYVGDYHALEKYQQFQAQLLEDMADRPVLLAIEMLYGRNQRALDDWMHERIDDEQLQRRVRYQLEWGYGWEGYRKVLEVARRRKIPVFCVDCSPRNDLRYIRRRDSAVAAKIADILARHPDRTLVVCFGESHLAERHLPSKVAALLPDGDGRRDVIILQNIDEIYWKAACGGSEDASVVRVSDSVYCVLNAAPFEKYEAYRRQLEVWKAHDEEDQQLDLTSTVYNLIQTIVDFVRIDKYSYCLAREGVCIEFFIDAYPEVYSRNELDVFENLLESSGFAGAQIQEILLHAMRSGSCYVPRVNAIFVGRFDLVHGAEEAAHFVNFALKRQRHQDYRPTPLPQADEFYLTVLEEALGYFGSKLIDARRNQVAESPILNWHQLSPEARRELGVTRRQLGWMRRFVLTHKELEFNYKRMRKPPRIIGQGVRSRGRVFRLLAHELGYMLGEQIYRSYVSGIFSRREIARLFHSRFEDEGPPAQTYFTLAEKVEALTFEVETPAAAG